MLKFLYWQIFILIVSTAVAGQDIARAKPVIGYGSSDAVYPSKNQEFFYMGFLLGFNRRIKKTTAKDFLSVKAMEDKEPFGALHSARYLQSQGIDLLVGFPTSHEALLVSDYAVKNNLLFISAAAVHSDLAKFGPLIHTLAPSSRTITKHLLNFIEKKEGKQKGLIISNPEDLFSMNHHRMVFQLIHEPDSPALNAANLAINKKEMLLPSNIQNCIISLNREKTNAISNYSGQITNPYRHNLENQIKNFNVTQNRKLKLGIVDDEPFYRHALNQLIKESTILRDSVDTFMFENKDDLFKMIFRDHLDLLICDIDFGADGYDGFEIVADLREKGYSLPVCMHSNRSLPKDYENAISVGAQALLPKPMPKDHLIKFIADTLPEHRHSPTIA